MFDVAILVTERDEQGRAIGRLLHDKPYAMPDYVSQPDGRVVDGEGRDLGTTVMGDVAISDGHYPLPEHED